MIPELVHLSSVPLRDLVLTSLTAPKIESYVFFSLANDPKNPLFSVVKPVFDKFRRFFYLRLLRLL
jgi:hypothetical protein